MSGEYMKMIEEQRKKK